MLRHWKNTATRARIDRIFHVPMLVLAFLTLPLLAAEFGAFGELRSVGRLLLEIGFWLIWGAFAVEFVIKISIADGKWHYVRRNWLDIIVIAAPMLRPLRTLRIARGARLGSVFRSMRLLAYRTAARKGLAVLVLAIAQYRALRKGLQSGRGQPRKAPQASSELDALREEVAALRERVAALETRLDRLAALVEEAFEEDASRRRVK